MQRTIISSIHKFSSLILHANQTDRGKYSFGNSFEPMAELYETVSDSAYVSWLTHNLIMTLRSKTIVFKLNGFKTFHTV